MNPSEPPKRLGRPPKPAPEAPSKMRRRPRPKPVFRAIEEFDLILADRAALIQCLELARDPNSTPKERSEAMRAYAALRRAFDGGDRDAPEGGSLREHLDELLATRRETSEVAPGRANGFTNGSAPKL